MYRFSDVEIKDLLKAWFAISLAFSFVGGGLSLENLFISGTSVGIAFIFHELAHKFVAQRYGLWAEFRAFDTMLILAVAMAYFTGFIFAAPGAVMISGYTGSEESGKTSIAGPLTNIALALILALCLNTFGSSLPLLGQKVLFEGYRINGWLAFFNLLPFGIFDGSKVFAWNRGYWLGAVTVAFLLTFTHIII